MPDKIFSSYPCFYPYWGKTKRKKEQPGDDYHLLVYHCLDVAACGYWLVKRERFCAGVIFQRLGFSLQQGATFFAWLLAMHDLGKFTRGFQQLSVYPQLVQPVDGRKYLCGHDSLGYWLWNNYVRGVLLKNGTAGVLPPLLGEKQRDVLADVMQMIMGHHGKPPDTSADGCLAVTNEDKQAVREWMSALADLFPQVHLSAQSEDENWFKKEFRSASWPLAGLTVLADWLGSWQHYFPFKATPIPLAEYWQLALQQASQAIDQLPTPVRCAEFSTINHLFPYILQPTPLQKKAATIPITAGAPDLFVFEDVTGAGKTEAALILASRLMAQGKGNGLYIGLPTMATANAMFHRLERSYRRLFTAECAPSLVLAHSARKLNTHFQQALWNSNQPFSQQEYVTGEATGQASCHYWFADSPKKALLADVGAGTLDQALMAVMPYRHQCLRMLGLQNKILILDEIHACDAWLNRIVEHLLAYHASQGGSAIILSATLSQKQRESLVTAFARGHSCQHEAGLLKFTPAAPYPLLTHYGISNGATTSEVMEYPLQSPPEVSRAVQVGWLHNEQDCLQQIREAVKKGQCIAWIRNTVDDAIRIYQALANELDSDQLILFHSRFAFCDRLEIEERVLAWCGDKSGATERQGKVVIATQVIEQSLDLDFDAMLTDLAPIDLLIQRAGRLQRHIRDKAGNRLQPPASSDQRAAPLLHILAPEWQEHPEQNWLQHLLPGSGYIYPDHGRLWLAQKILRQFGEIRMPEHARVLIEEVYGKVPEQLTHSSEKKQGQDYADRACAEQLLLKIAPGYCNATYCHWYEDVELTTRSGEPVRRLYLARRQAGEIIPYGSGDAAWEMSRLQIRESQWKKIKQQIPHLQGDELKQQQTKHYLSSAEIIILPERCDFYCSARGLHFMSLQAE